MTGAVALFFVLFMNLLVFAFGCAITGFSYLAYRSSNGNKSFRRSTIGFGLITLGCIVEPAYVGINHDWAISGQELLQLQAIESTAIAVGLGFLFVSIYTHKRTVATDRELIRVSSEDGRTHPDSR